MSTECLQPDVISGYIDGRLSAAAAEAVETHLLACDDCLEELALAGVVVAEFEKTAREPAPGTVVQGLLEKIRGKMESFFQWSRELAPPDWMLSYGTAAVRGSRQAGLSVGSVFVRKGMDDLQTEMFLTRTRDDNVSISVKVFEGGKDASNVCLTLLRNGKSPLARFMNRKRYEVFDKLHYGTYNLILEQKAKRKGNFLFQIDGNGFYEKQDHLS